MILQTGKRSNYKIFIALYILLKNYLLTPQEVDKYIISFKRREIVCRVSAGLIMVSGLLFFCRGSFVIFIASATLVVECIRVKQAGCSYERDGHLQLELVVIYQAQINRADYRRSSSSSVSCLAFRVRQILRLMNSSLYFCWIMFDE